MSGGSERVIKEERPPYSQTYTEMCRKWAEEQKKKEEEEILRSKDPIKKAVMRIESHVHIRLDRGMRWNPNEYIFFNFGYRTEHDDATGFAIANPMDAFGVSCKDMSDYTKHNNFDEKSIFSDYYIKCKPGHSSMYKLVKKEKYTSPFNWIASLVNFPGR